MRAVAVLCCAPRSVYKTLLGVECYDKARDVRTFAGGMPVVAHPPCRSWSAYCAHQAKPEPGEKELGPLCVGWLRKCGGVLEHPAHSRLFAECGLPMPGRSHPGVWVVEVSQSLWGDSREKLTWLAFFGVPPSEISIPFSLTPTPSTGSRRRWQLMSRAQRSATPPAMAQWLVDAARKSVTTP